MGYRNVPLIISIMVATLIGQLIYAENVKEQTDIKTSIIVHLNLTPDKEIWSKYPGEMILRSLIEQYSPSYHFSIIKHRRITARPPKQRNPELSSDQLLVVAFDAKEKEIARIIIPDPRLIRAETFSLSGEIMTSREYYRESTDFTLILPANPKISSLKFYHPYWTGTEFILQLFGEVPLNLHDRSRR
ncbi:MAG: hypothetical protein A2Y81_03540 [Nitrospirae bacterium RBG_13_43_8]|nr:MAG: hypothetical protein A2Y81_03540 [Nitrospirae bacterium RBG_13_43_8]